MAGPMVATNQAAASTLGKYSRLPWKSKGRGQMASRPAGRRAGALVGVGDHHGVGQARALAVQLAAYDHPVDAGGHRTLEPSPPPLSHSLLGQAHLLT